jgi:hypothetical protein
VKTHARARRGVSDAGGGPGEIVGRRLEARDRGAGLEIERPSRRAGDVERPAHQASVIDATPPVGSRSGHTLRVRPASDAPETLHEPRAFRAALMHVPPDERDVWVDALFGIDGLPPDGPELPRGCVPYLPCSVDAIVRMIDAAGVGPSDVFVDVGSGLGRAALLTHFATGAQAIGIEVQRALVHTSRAMAARLAARLSVIEGDAADLVGLLPIGTVFFLYCPFGSARLEKVLADLESLARVRPIRIATVDLPLADLPWLERLTPAGGDLAVFRSRNRG